MDAIAIVLASGTGQRFEAKDIPKHLTTILGIPIIVWTLNAVVRSELFSSVVVVVRGKDIFKTRQVIKEYFYESGEFIRVATGSNERMQSFFLGLRDLDNINLSKKKTIVGLFDANRPFTPIDQIVELCRVASESGCACPVRPVVNGIARIKLDRIVNVPEKSKYVEYATPEFMQFDALSEAIKNNESSLSSLVEYALSSGINPATCDASILNSKLTFPEDKTYLEGLAIDNNLLSMCTDKSNK